MLGAVLALTALRGRRLRSHGALHGLTGASGFVLLLIALRGPPRGEAMGVGSFGVVAAVLFAIALALGVAMALFMRGESIGATARATSNSLFARATSIARGPFSGLLIAVHASIAIAAFVLFLAWASLG